MKGEYLGEEGSLVGNVRGEVDRKDGEEGIVDRGIPIIHKLSL